MPGDDEEDDDEDEDEEADGEKDSNQETEIDLGEDEEVLPEPELWTLTECLVYTND